jgi:hypothetical protein
MKNEDLNRGAGKMTEKEILDIKPGIELNIEVAKKIMGHRVIKDETLGYMELIKNPKSNELVSGLVQPYSEDISLAGLIIDKMAEKGYEDASSWADFGGGTYTEPEAISKAALCAILKEEKKNEISDRILKQALGEE